MKLRIYDQARRLVKAATRLEMYFEDDYEGAQRELSLIHGLCEQIRDERYLLNKQLEEKQNGITGI